MTSKALKVLPLVILLCVAAAGAVLVASGGAGPYTVRIYLLNAERLTPGSNVDMGGVPAGRVSSVQLAPDTGAAGAIVTIQLDSQYVPLRRGTRAVIQPNGAVGENFLELHPVASGSAIPSGGSIPLQDTQVPVTIDQVTDILNASTRQELKTVIQQGSVALAGRSAGVNHVLSKLPRITSGLAATTGSLDQQTGQLSELAAEFNRVAAMIAGEHQALQGDVSNGASVLSTLATHQASLQQALSHASSSLAQANSALAGRQQNVRQLLEELPALLAVLQALESHATTSVSILNPCMRNILTTLSELASADSYTQAAGATDGTGSMLRINPQLVGGESGSFAPQAACSGG